MGVAVKETAEGYEVFVSNFDNDRIDKYTAADNYSEPVQKLHLKEPRRLNWTQDGKLIAAYYNNVGIIEPENMELIYHSENDSDLDASIAVVEKDGYLYVTGYRSNKVVVFEVMGEEIVRVGEITDNSLKTPEGIEVRGDKLLISSNAGWQNNGGNIWEVTLRPRAVQGRVDKKEVTAIPTAKPLLAPANSVSPAVAVSL